MNLELLTERLRLTPLVDADIDISIEMFTDPQVLKYVCDPLFEDEIRTGISDWTKRGGNGCIGIWCISDQMSAEKYGDAYLLPLSVEEPDNDFSLVIPGQMPAGDIEIGFFLKPSAWGKGYATEVCRRLLEFAFQDSPLNELVSSVNEEHVASKHVLEKSGLIDRGYMRCYGEVSPIYRITRDEWEAMQRST
jgi:ribosomal-protein-alanine N-acetyltransferase